MHTSLLIHTHIYTCVYTRLYKYTCINMNTHIFMDKTTCMRIRIFYYMHTHARLRKNNINTHTCIHTPMQICTYLATKTSIKAFTRGHSYMLTHKYKHTHKYTYTHALIYAYTSALAHRRLQDICTHHWYILSYTHSSAYIRK